MLRLHDHRPGGHVAIGHNVGDKVEPSGRWLDPALRDSVLPEQRTDVLHTSAYHVETDRILWSEPRRFRKH